MKKLKIVFVILGIVLILSVVYFMNRYQKIDNRIVSTTINPNITMIIKNGTLTNRSVTVIVTDNNEKTYGHDFTFRIDRKENGKWKKLNFISTNYVVGDNSFLVTRGKPFEIKLDWENIYGKLRKGEYRLVKTVYNDVDDYEGEYFYVEFTIH